MANYSIALGFFLPRRIVEALKEVKASGKVAFDWRKSGLCHCTLKAISLCDEMPEKEVLDGWARESKKILDGQKPFEVNIQGVSKFPTALFAKVKSDELIMLHKRLFGALPSSQPQFENENYVPHASIGMLNQDVKIISGKTLDFGKFKVREVNLAVWDLRDLNKNRVWRRFKLMEHRG